METVTDLREIHTQIILNRFLLSYINISTNNKCSLIAVFRLIPKINFK
jgi:hypothetical protein